MPLALTDAELDIITNAAKPLPPHEFPLVEERDSADASAARTASASAATMVVLIILGAGPLSPQP